MCKELPVILVNKVVDPKRIIRKTEGQGGGEAQGVGDQKKKNSDLNLVNALWIIIVTLSFLKIEGIFLLHVRTIAKQNEITQCMYSYNLNPLRGFEPRMFCCKRRKPISVASPEVDAQGCQIFLGTKYQNGKKFTKLPLTIPNVHKI
jgi:hypothetical protein